MLPASEECCGEPLRESRPNFSADLDEQVLEGRQVVDWDAYDELRVGLLPYRPAWLGRLPKS
jgi:hypothetical protein